MVVSLVCECFGCVIIGLMCSVCWLVVCVVSVFDELACLFVYDGGWCFVLLFVADSSLC